MSCTTCCVHCRRRPSAALARLGCAPNPHGRLGRGAVASEGCGRWEGRRAVPPLRRAAPRHRRWPRHRLVPIARRFPLVSSADADEVPAVRPRHAAAAAGADGVRPVPVARRRCTVQDRVQLLPGWFLGDASGGSAARAADAERAVRRGGTRYTLRATIPSPEKSAPSTRTPSRRNCATTCSATRPSAPSRWRSRRAASRRRRRQRHGRRDDRRGGEARGGAERRAVEPARRHRARGPRRRCPRPTRWRRRFARGAASSASAATTPPAPRAERRPFLRRVRCRLQLPTP